MPGHPASKDRGAAAVSRSRRRHIVAPDKTPRFVRFGGGLRHTAMVQPSHRGGLPEPTSWAVDRCPIRAAIGKDEHVTRDTVFEGHFARRRELPPAGRLTLT